jgi:hypothetical protein
MYTLCEYLGSLLLYVLAYKKTLTKKDLVKKKLHYVAEKHHFCHYDAAAIIAIYPSPPCCEQTPPQLVFWQKITQGANSLIVYGADPHGLSQCPPAAVTHRIAISPPAALS